MSDDAGGRDQRLSLKAGIFHVLLAAGPTPVAIERMAEALGACADEIEAGIAALAPALAELALVLERTDRGVEMRRASIVDEALRLRPGRKISDEALLTVMLLVKRGPMTAPELARIRRVDDPRDVLVTLLDAGLIHEAGRRDTRGRPFVYEATDRGRRLVAPVVAEAESKGVARENEAPGSPRSDDRGPERPPASPSGQVTP